MLELWSAQGDPFAEVEGYLHDAAFFDGGAVELVADLYLGYGLSRRIRRGSSPDPPETCRLPLVACRIRPEAGEPPVGGDFSIGPWRRTWPDDAYASAVEAVRDAIAKGDVYQVNLVQHLHADRKSTRLNSSHRL